MEQYDVERIRRTTFSQVRRGYEIREVDKFLSDLAEWLESGAQDEAGSYAVKRKLERAGDTAGRILATAEEEAYQMVKEAEESSSRKREESENQARKTTEAALAKARRIVEEGERRRQDIEAVIADLVQRRDAVLSDLDSLVGKLRQAVTQHTPPKGSDPFARPKSLDPAEPEQAVTPSEKAAATAKS